MTQNRNSFIIPLVNMYLVFEQKKTQKLDILMFFSREVEENMEMEEGEESQLVYSPDIPTKKPTQKKDRGEAGKVGCCFFVCVMIDVPFGAKINGCVSQFLRTSMVVWKREQTPHSISLLIVY